MNVSDEFKNRQKKQAYLVMGLGIVTWFLVLTWVLMRKPGFMQASLVFMVVTVINLLIIKHFAKKALKCPSCEKSVKGQLTESGSGDHAYCPFCRVELR